MLKGLIPIADHRLVLFCRRMSARIHSGTTDQPEIIQPRPIGRLEAGQIAGKGMRESDGVTESDRLLQAIIVLARREPPTIATRIALRSLIVKCSREIALDF